MIPQLRDGRPPPPRSRRAGLQMQRLHDRAVFLRPDRHHRLAPAPGHDTLDPVMAHPVHHIRQRRPRIGIGDHIHGRLPLGSGLHRNLYMLGEGWQSHGEGIEDAASQFAALPMLVAPQVNCRQIVTVGNPA